MTTKQFGNGGFITMAYGPDRYFRQAETLARSLRMHMPGIRLAIVTDRKDPGALFDIAIPMAPFETAGTLHKINLYDYSPFEETLFIDSDCLVVRPFHDELDAIRKTEFTPIVSTYLGPDDTDLWLEDIGQALMSVGGQKFPKFNGGIYYFRKGDVAAGVFEEAKRLLPRAKDLGVKDFDGAGPGDETLIGLAMAKLGLYTPFDDGGRFMRTPLGSKGQIIVDPFLSKARFWKYGRIVEPAIVHYCGPWIDHTTYKLAAKGLADGRRVMALERYWAGFSDSAGQLRSKIDRKLLAMLRRG